MHLGYSNFERYLYFCFEKDTLEFVMCQMQVGEKEIQKKLSRREKFTSNDSVFHSPFAFSIHRLHFPFIEFIFHSPNSFFVHCFLFPFTVHFFRCHFIFRPHQKKIPSLKNFSVQQKKSRPSKKNLPVASNFFLCLMILFSIHHLHFPFTVCIFGLSNSFSVHKIHFMFTVFFFRPSSSTFFVRRFIFHPRQEKIMSEKNSVQRKTIIRSPIFVQCFHFSSNILVFHPLF